MIFRPLLKELLFSSILVLTLHKIALTLFLYWTTEWFDVLMHFLGGLTIGFLMLFVFHSLKIISLNRDNILLFFMITIGGVLVIGLMWELWEIFVGFTDVLEDEIDTVLDIVMDLLGGVVAFLYFKIKISNSNE